jgi:hypothetical protein
VKPQASHDRRIVQGSISSNTGPNSDTSKCDVNVTFVTEKPGEKRKESVRRNSRFVKVTAPCLFTLIKSHRREQKRRRKDTESGDESSDEHRGDPGSGNGSGDDEYRPADDGGIVDSQNRRSTRSSQCLSSDNVDSRAKPRQKAWDLDPLRRNPYTGQRMSEEMYESMMKRMKQPFAWGFGPKWYERSKTPGAESSHAPSSPVSASAEKTSTIPNKRTIAHLEEELRPPNTLNKRSRDDAYVSLLSIVFFSR